MNFQFSNPNRRSQSEGSMLFGSVPYRVAAAAEMPVYACIWQLAYITTFYRINRVAECSSVLFTLSIPQE